MFAVEGSKMCRKHSQNLSRLKTFPLKKGSSEKRLPKKYNSLKSILKGSNLVRLVHVVWCQVFIYFPWHYFPWYANRNVIIGTHHDKSPNLMYGMWSIVRLGYLQNYRLLQLSAWMENKHSVCRKGKLLLLSFKKVKQQQNLGW